MDSVSLAIRIRTSLDLYPTLSCISTQTRVQIQVSKEAVEAVIEPMEISEFAIGVGQKYRDRRVPAWNGCIRPSPRHR